MDAWNSDYDKQRVEAELRLELAIANLVNLELAEDVPLASSQGVQEPGQFQDYKAITDKWCPETLRNLPFTDRALTKDVECRPQTLAEAMDSLRVRIDQTFGWDNKISEPPSCF